MKITKIELHNFGPYEDTLSLDTNVSNDKNIVLIGGKNGAGKTTLFTAMKMCLYGYVGLGHKSPNTHYYNAVKRLINNAAKMKKPTLSYVKISLEIKNRRDIDLYELKRSWVLDDGVKEDFLVFKNDELLDEENMSNFEKFLISYIPPALFNLYFFDGEEIADFFLNNGANKRIKNAFLTVCGYDIFEIMKQNFIRVSSQGKSGSNEVMTKYIDLKEKYRIKKEELSTAMEVNNEIKTKISELDAQLMILDKKFKESGGISYKENEEKMAILKEEDKKRELINARIKELANDVIPFLMIKSNVEKLEDRVLKENKLTKYSNFIDVLDELNKEDLASIVETHNEKQVLDSLKQYVLSKKITDKDKILKLSFEQSGKLLNKIEDILNNDPDELAKLKRMHKRSINKSSKIRKEMESSDVVIYQKYLNDRTQLLDMKSEQLKLQLEQEKIINEITKEYGTLEEEFGRIKSKFEDNLKEQSKADISGKAILMLDHLAEVLYNKKIEGLQVDLVKNLNMLMRKFGFVDEVIIDDEFNVRLYKTKLIKVNELIEIFKSKSLQDIIVRIGSRACSEISSMFSTSDLDELYKKLLSNQGSQLYLPIEINKESMSNGEKQIYIMALYYSLVCLSNLEIPFIIDTPFARIDTEHRNNICEHFFKKLNGQVFILSTNEEIDSSNFKIIEENVAKTYMLENTDNSKTNILKNKYFE